jgi:hypothetical protein
LLQRQTCQRERLLPEQTYFRKGGYDNDRLDRERGCYRNRPNLEREAVTGTDIPYSKRLLQEQTYLRQREVVTTKDFAEREAVTGTDLR